MDQSTIGRFIAELRKENNMTQANLAEQVGVSDKTISKWECGRGIPDIANMKQLCNVFHISINEMISGERIKENLYEEKAEDTIYHLIERVEKDKKGKMYHILYPLLSILTVATLIELTMLIYAINLDDIIYMIDIPSIIAMLLLTTVFLLISGLFPYTYHGLTYVMGRKHKEHSDLVKSSIAIKYMQQSILYSGISVMLKEQRGYSDEQLDQWMEGASLYHQENLNEYLDLDNITMKSLTGPHTIYKYSPKEVAKEILEFLEDMK